LLFCAHILALSRNNDVIQVALHPLIFYCLEDTIHVSLKDRGCVAQPEQHDGILVGPHEALQGSANLLAFLHADLVVDVLKINLGEPVHPGKIQDDLVYKQKRLQLVDGCLIYLSLVDLDPCTSILI
jgi:hypothetical protein